MSSWKCVMIAAAIGAGTSIGACAADTATLPSERGDVVAPDRAPIATPRWDGERTTSPDDPGALAQPDPTTQPDTAVDIAPPPGTVPSRKVGGALVVRPMTRSSVTPGDFEHGDTQSRMPDDSASGNR